ncbi:MAG: hypothetical protein KDC92_16080, partial [Bacteroidetes bacterium]|nr:hypothetical protein [Bacteroidota bacterium]
MKSITLLLSLLILSTCNISYAAVDIFLTSERYPNATTLEVDIHIRDQSSNFDLGGNTTNFTLSTINFSYSTFGTGAGQLSVKTGTPTHHLTGYGVSVSAP